jgi:hypothetical protein
MRSVLSQSASALLSPGPPVPHTCTHDAVAPPLISLRPQEVVPMGHGVPLWVTAGPKRGRHLTRREPGKLPSNAVSQLCGPGQPKIGPGSCQGPG